MATTFDPVKDALKTTKPAQGIVASAAQSPAAALARPSYEPPAGIVAQAAKLPKPTEWAVTDDQTVEGRINRIIGAGSPLQAQAKNRAVADANARGLANTSMAVTAGESALYDSALPIAQADAGIFAKAAGYNADTANQFAIRDTEAENAMRQQGAQHTLQWGLAGQDDSRVRDLAGMDDSRIRTLADQENERIRALADQENSRLREATTMQDARERALATMTDTRTRDLAGMEDDRIRDLEVMGDKRARDLATLERQQQRDMALINRETERQMATLNADLKAKADAVQQQHQKLLETNAQAASAFSTGMSAINNIQNNNEMDANTKTQAVAQVWRDLQTQLNVLGSVAGLNLTGQLNFAGYPGYDLWGRYVGFDANGNTAG